jgi:hypothetical protein
MEDTLTTEDTPTMEDTPTTEDIKRPRDSRTTEDIKMVRDTKTIPRDIMTIETMEEAAEIKNMTDIKMVVEKITGMTMVVAVAGEATCREES